ncbi:MAG: sortase, partial [Ruminococcus sp.]|nr:sortase [Ruminococcus sp.]
DQTLAYEVDQIKVVIPTETTDLLIEEDEDYVTLITCTPYGVNSHRLLVRGTRVPYVEEEFEELRDNTEPVESTWMAEYKRALILGAVVLSTIIVIFVVLRILLSKHKKKKEEKQVN